MAARAADGTRHACLAAALGARRAGHACAGDPHDLAGFLRRCCTRGGRLRPGRPDAAYHHATDSSGRARGEACPASHARAAPRASRAAATHSADDSAGGCRRTAGAGPTGTRSTGISSRCTGAGRCAWPAGLGSGPGGSSAASRPNAEVDVGVADAGPGMGAPGAAGV